MQTSMQSDLQKDEGQPLEAIPDLESTILSKLEGFGIPIDDNAKHRIHSSCIVHEEAKRFLYAEDPFFAEALLVPPAKEEPATDPKTSKDPQSRAIFKQIFGYYPNISEDDSEGERKLRDWIATVLDSPVTAPVSRSRSIPIEFHEDAITNREIANYLYYYLKELSLDKSENEALDKVNKMLDLIKSIDPANHKFFGALDRPMNEFMVKARQNGWQNIVSVIEREEDVVWGIFSDLGSQNEVELSYVYIMGLTPEDVQKRRQENWQIVDRWLSSRSRNLAEKPISKDDIDKIHRLSTKGIIPRSMAGIRKEGRISIGTHIAPQTNQMHESLDIMLDMANRIAGNGYNPFSIPLQLAKLGFLYATIHPHVDGNGTAGIFFCELVARSAGMEPAKITTLNYNKRLINLLRYNPVALFWLEGKHKETFTTRYRRKDPNA